MKKNKLKKLLKRKKQRKDYETKVKANKRLSKKATEYFKDGKRYRTITRRPSLCAGDGILPKSRKYTPPKVKKEDNK